MEAVDQGRAVVIYPEGTITRDPDLWPMAGKTGAARIALRTGCPVIPIGQWGAQELMYGPQIHFPSLLPRKTLRLLVGDPVDLGRPARPAGQRRRRWPRPPTGSWTRSPRWSPSCGRSRRRAQRFVPPPAPTGARAVTEPEQRPRAGSR